MKQQKFHRAAQMRKFKAVIITVVFHLILLGAVTYGTGGHPEELIPDVIKEYFSPETTVKGKGKEVA